MHEIDSNKQLRQKAMKMNQTSKSIPFTKIVLTFPTKSAADTSEPFLRSLLASAFESCIDNAEIIVTSDPHNVKLGSGGGTLAALSLVMKDGDMMDDVVLIIHAGGNQCNQLLCYILISPSH